MTGRPIAFRKVDVKRAVSGAKAAGLTISRVEIDQTGKITLVSEVDCVSSRASEADAAFYRWEAKYGEKAERPLPHK